MRRRKPNAYFFFCFFRLRTFFFFFLLDCFFVRIEAFLSLDLPGTKVVVGAGPARETLMRRYPQAVFLGQRQGEGLACIYAAADVFVFPSCTDTFGPSAARGAGERLAGGGFPSRGASRRYR